MTPKPQTIIRLQAENVMRLEAVSVDAKGATVVEVQGKNGAGKTTVLRSIEMALAGGRSIPEEPIRQGEAKSRIVVETQDFTVTRRFTKNGSTLVVESRDGVTKYTKPQDLLNGLVGQLTFDPLAFANAPKAQQVETLKTALGLDFTAQDTERKRLYEERRDVNRDAAQAKARQAALPFYSDAPAEDQSIAALMTELQNRQNANRENHATRARSTELERFATKKSDAYTDLVAREAEMVAALEALRARMKEAGAVEDQAKAHAETAREDVLALVNSDENEILAQVSAAEGVNRQVAANREFRRHGQVIAGLEKKSSALTDDIAAIDKAKQDAIAGAELPVAGLTFTDAGVFLDGVPFEQASKAMQIRVSAGVGFALNPTIRVMLIYDGSLLDDNTMSELETLARSNGSQIWIERVSNDETVKVVLVPAEEGEKC